MNRDIEFNKIVSDILNCDKFIELKYEMHHGISRLDHSLNVAHLTYNICRKFKIKKCDEITRAALLHDFFYNNQITSNSFANHPKKALENAKGIFDINSLQENIIASHMFPVGGVLPKYCGSWGVSVADKIIATKEMVKYKAPLAFGTALILVINFMTIERYINWW